MQKIDDSWLAKRGDLHDATLLSVCLSGQCIEISLNDEWANERGLSLPHGEMAPGSLVFENASVVRGALHKAKGGWISSVEIRDTLICFKFCDRAPLTLHASAATWRNSD